MRTQTFSPVFGDRLCNLNFVFDDGGYIFAEVDKFVLEKACASSFIDGIVSITRTKSTGGLMLVELFIFLL